MYRTRLIIPGMTMLNMGNSFRNPHRTQPPFTWDKFFPARQPWTKICRGDAGGGWGFFRVCEQGWGLQQQGVPWGGKGGPTAHPAPPATPRHTGPQETRVTGQHVLLGARLPERMGAACPWPHCWSRKPSTAVRHLPAAPGKDETPSQRTQSASACNINPSTGLSLTTNGHSELKPNSLISAETNQCTP